MTRMLFAAVGATLALAAAALTAGTAGAEAKARTCMLMLAETASDALVLNRGADMLLSDCGMTVNSSSSAAAVFNRGGTLNAKRFCVPNGKIADNSGIYPVPSNDCQTEADFMAGRYKPPAAGKCQYFGRHYYDARFVLSPGVYCGWFYFDPGSQIVLKPGIYVLKQGGFLIGGETFRGRDVSIHLADSSIIQFNPTVAAYLAAPRSGPMAGFLITEAPRKSVPISRRWIVVNAVKSVILEGFIHLPNRYIGFNRGSMLSAKRFALVARRIQVNEGVIRVRRGE